MIKENLDPNKKLPFVLSSMVGFHLDEENDWVAELQCGHFQHVRHNPPFINRPWVITKSGRLSMLGKQLKCVKCVENAPKDFIVPSFIYRNV